MIEFYRRVLSGTPRAEALRGAQLDVKRGASGAGRSVTMAIWLVVPFLTAILVTGSG
jgi:CHAT domain-containing protein